MAAKRNISVLCLVAYLLHCSLIVSAATCTSKLSIESGCNECTEWGHCVPGSVPVTDWLKYALMTQRELQIDFTFDQFIMFDSHNSFQARGYGDRYGANDSCVWPPPYQENCTSVGNHEFSIVDQLNLGVRGIEMDNWYCYDEMRICHLGSHTYLGVCEPDHMLYSDLMQSVGDWLDEPENQNEIIRIYLNEKGDQEHDDLVNGPIQAAFDNRVLTPADFRDTYGGSWPTIRKMREDGKHVILAASGTDGFFFTHGDVYIRPLYFDADLRTNLFTGYPECGGRNNTNIVRVYSDTLNFPLNEDENGYYSGQDSVGSIKDLTEYVKCRTQYPAMDMINQELMQTGVFTWAEGQPAGDLTHASCIMLKGSDHRWYTATDCSVSHYYACQNDVDPELWMKSDQMGPYTITGDVCPQGYSFSVPHNGFRQYRLTLSSSDNDVWLNFSPWLPAAPTTQPSTTSAADRIAAMSSLCFFVYTAIVVAMRAFQM